MKQKGQVIIVLLLIILVSLTIGLAVVQNSLTDISTSTKTDQASRAYSAAEAGLESALLTDSESDVTVGTSKAKININSDLPGPGQALEYPPISKADFAQFWFQAPNPADRPAKDYNQTKFVIEFGNCSPTPCWNPPPGGDYTPALELNLILQNAAGNYFTVRGFFDPISSRSSENHFVNVSAKCDSTGGNKDNTSSSSSSVFYCKLTADLTSPSDFPGYTYNVNDKMILARARILYSTSYQKVAIGPVPNTAQLPPQATTYKSTGIAGNSSRELKVFREKKVVPYFFDYAIFSNTNVEK